MRRVIIFRNQLFKASEPFIVQQASQLQRYAPIFVGRDIAGSEPAGASTIALQGSPKGRGFLRRGWQAVTRDTRQYARMLSAVQPNLMHAHFGVDAVYALPLARRLQVPLVTTFHGFDVTTARSQLLMSGSPARINFVMHRSSLARQGRLFLCVSEFIRTRALELGFPPERTLLHYIGVDVRAISPGGAGSGAPRILHVARLTEKKGTAYLIKAFASLKSIWRDSELIIIGDGPLKGSLEALSRELQVASRVRFLGALPHADVLDWMRRAAFIVLPSITARDGDSEGLGMVLLEAAAVGLPVVGTIHGGIPEAVVDGETGFLVPERDVSALAEKMGALLESPGLRGRLGVSARSLVESRFNIVTQTARLELLYDGALA